MIEMMPLYVSDYERACALEWRIMALVRARNQTQTIIVNGRPTHISYWKTGGYVPPTWWQLLIDDLEEVW